RLDVELPRVALVELNLDLELGAEPFLRLVGRELQGCAQSHAEFDSETCKLHSRAARVENLNVYDVSVRLRPFARHRPLEFGEHDGLQVNVVRPHQLIARDGERLGGNVALCGVGGARLQLSFGYV